MTEHDCELSRSLRDPHAVRMRYVCDRGRKDEGRCDRELPEMFHLQFPFVMP
jgi:hypothetical protein